MIYRQKNNSRAVFAVLVAIAVISCIVYDYVSTTRVSAATGTLGEGQVNGPSKEVIAVVEQIESIQLDGSFFTDSVYQSLQDFTVIVTPQPVGKVNPFAPVGSAPASSQPSSTRSGR